MYNSCTACGNGNFIIIDCFHLSVRITGKLLKIDGYNAARGLASTELSFHSCNVLRDCRRGVPRANKKGLGT